MKTNYKGFTVYKVSFFSRFFKKRKKNKELVKLREVLNNLNMYRNIEDVYLDYERRYQFLNLINRKETSKLFYTFGSFVDYYNRCNTFIY